MEQDDPRPTELRPADEGDQKEGIGIRNGTIPKPTREPAVQMDRHPQVLALQQGGREQGRVHFLICLALPALCRAECALRLRLRHGMHTEAHSFRQMGLNADESITGDRSIQSLLVVLQQPLVGDGPF